MILKWEGGDLNMMIHSVLEVAKKDSSNYSREFCGKVIAKRLALWSREVAVLNPFKTRTPLEAATKEGSIPSHRFDFNIPRRGSLSPHE